MNTLCWYRQIYRLADLFFLAGFPAAVDLDLPGLLEGQPLITYNTVSLFSDSLELASATYQGGKAVLLQVAGVCVW